MRIDLSVAGLKIAFEARDPRLVATVEAAWKPALRPAHAHPHRHYVVGDNDRATLNGAPWSGDQELCELVPQIELDILRAVVATHSSQIILHAGGVVLNDHLLLFVGESGAGKTSFTREALRSGGSYLSDDLLIVGGGSVRGLARTVQFDPLPRSNPVPDYLEDCDCHSYQVGNPQRKPTRVPLWTADHHTLEAFEPTPEKTVVVELRRAGFPISSSSTPSAGRTPFELVTNESSFEKKGDLERYRFLHAASLMTARTYDGFFGSGPTWALAWTHPGRDFENLRRHLSLL